MALTSINPATGETLERFDELDATAIDTALGAAARAFREHRSGSVAERARRLEDAARILDADRARLARIAVTEMGKPLRAALAEVEKCARTCRHYAEHGAA